MKTCKILFLLLAQGLLVFGNDLSDDKMSLKCVLPQNQFVEDGENWKYISSGGAIDIPSSKINRPVYVDLLEIKDIDVAGFDTARIYVRLKEKDFFDKETGGKFVPQKTALEVGCFHNLGMSSCSYFKKAIYAEETTVLGGFMVVPIIGTSIRVLVWGHELPQKALELEYSIYLIK